MIIRRRGVILDYRVMSLTKEWEFKQHIIINPAKVHVKDSVEWNSFDWLCPVGYLVFYYFWSSY